MKKIFTYCAVALLFSLSSKSLLFAQAPVADFVASKTKGCDYLAVQFEDKSSNKPTSWTWDFGNGDFAQNITSKEVASFYAKPGVYTVKMTATNASGSSEKTMTIEIFSEPKANFTAKIREGCTPMEITFENNSTSEGGAITKYQWNLGDGSGSSEKSPVYTYATKGEFDISLRVVDANGCENTSVQPNFIKVNQTPTASFTSSSTESCANPFTVNFTNTSVDADSYKWNFGDGTTSSDENPSHTYTENGDFTVSLEVKTADGCSSILEKKDLININTFAADFSVDKPTVCKNAETSFSDSSDASVVSWLWNFGDGATSTLQNPTHAYSAAGKYTVTLTSTSAAGCSSTKTYEDAVTVLELPTVDIQAKKTIACAAPFTAEFFTDTKDLTSYAWDFGDAGASSTQKDPSHTYTAEGFYNVKLTVTDKNGCSNTETKDGLIKIAKPIIDIKPNKNGGCAPVQIQFRDSSVSQSKIVDWAWDFGDGKTSTEQNPKHEYKDTGRYDVTLTVTDEIGCTNTLTMPSLVGAGMKPTISFSVDNNEVCFGETQIFTATNSDFTNGWEWNFHDGSGIVKATEPAKDYVYAKPGEYTVTHYAKHNGCLDSLEVVDMVVIKDPMVEFVVDGDNFICSYPDTIRFEDNTQKNDLTIANGDLYKYSWDFGDGNILVVDEFLKGQYKWTKNGADLYADTTSKNPWNEYTTKGEYEVELIVLNKGNLCEDTSTVNVYASQVDADFDIIPISTCKNSGTEFKDISKSPFPIKSWYWDFGDGTPAVWVDDKSAKDTIHNYDNTTAYSPKLVVKDSYCADSVKQTIPVMVFDLPKSKFSVADTTGCAPFEITASDLSTVTLGEIKTWFWNFGDGNTLTIDKKASGKYDWTYSNGVVKNDESSNSPVKHEYKRGTYDLTLTTTDSKGCDSTTAPQKIYSTKPYMSYVVEPVNCHYDTVAFEIVTNPQTTLADSAFVYTWDFGGGKAPLTNPADADTSRNYFVTKDTTIIVSLLATDFNGCDSTFIDTFNIVRPYALFEANETFTLCPTPPFMPNFTDKSTSNLTKWAWNFGDVNSGANNTSVFQNAQHHYADPGVYDVQLVVCDVNNCWDTLVKEDYIEVQGPRGKYKFSPEIECVPAPITMIAFDTSDVAQIDWYPGGGVLLDDANDTTVYTYMTGGTYYPAVEFVNSAGCRWGPRPDSALVTYLIEPEFIAAPIFACNDTTVVFADSSVATRIDGWLWEFGDSIQSTEQNPSQFFTYGKYDVTLTATVDFCDFKLTKPEYIQIEEMPETSFDVTTPAYSYEYVQFTNTSKELEHDYTWLWDFDNGQTNDTTVSPSFLFNKAEIYKVQLIQKTHDMCADTAFVYVEILGDVVLPNAFTPDGDGINDVYLEGLFYDLTIVNRWGQEIYSGTDGWDGKYKGEYVAGGTYFYIVRLPNGEVAKGPVTVLRKQ